MLTVAYQIQVEKRRKIFNSGTSWDIIKSVAKWLTEKETDGLLLYGTVGSGKSVMAEAIRTVLFSVGKKSSKTTALDLSNYAINRNDNDLYDSLKFSEILIIDDLGEEPKFVKSYGNDFAPLIEVLYYRYDKQLMTIITTNLLEEQIENIYGSRITDRFDETFDKKYFSQESYRKIK